MAGVFCASTWQGRLLRMNPPLHDGKAHSFILLGIAPYSLLFFARSMLSFWKNRIPKMPKAKLASQNRIVISSFPYELSSKMH